MDNFFNFYLRFRPCASPDKGMITEVTKWPLDYIFTPTASQEEVFNKFKYLADNMVSGKSACLVVIGGQESGRRYSIFGKFPTHNGIITRVTEEIVQSDNEYKIVLTVTDINGKSLIPPKISSDNTKIVRFETNLLEISQGISNEAFSTNFVLYKLVIKDTKTKQDACLNIVQLEDTDENLEAVYSLVNKISENDTKLLRTLKNLTEGQQKVSILMTCKEFKANTQKLRKLFHPETNTTEYITPNSEVEQLQSKVQVLEQQIKTLQDSLQESERRCHEYYESYHRTLLLINKDSAQNVFLNSQNESLIRQIRKETSLLQALEAKYQGLIDNCAKSHESTHVEFDSCLDSFLKSDSSVELNATDTLNLGISQVKLALAPDPSVNSPYSTELKQALEGNSELNKEVKILQLKNQVIEASVINANMSRMLSSFDWKFSMLKHRYEMKRLLSKQQHERIKSLEEMVEYLHESFQNLKKGTQEDKNIDKLFEKYCYKSIMDRERMVAESKKTMQDIEKKATEAYRRESQKWMDLLCEHKENYERELLRKQSEVIRLNELMGKWITKYMELQEAVTGCEKPLSIMYYSQIQDLIRETVKSSLENPKEKQMTPKAKNSNIGQKFAIISGDIHSPLE